MGGKAVQLRTVELGVSVLTIQVHDCLFGAG